VFALGLVLGGIGVHQTVTYQRTQLLELEQVLLQRSVKRDLTALKARLAPPPLPIAVVPTRDEADGEPTAPTAVAELEEGIVEPTPEPARDARRLAQQRALKDAQEFGMIGLLNSGSAAWPDEAPGIMGVPGGVEFGVPPNVPGGAYGTDTLPLPRKPKTEACSVGAMAEWLPEPNRAGPVRPN
jgi:hypothetical protein